MSTPKQDAPPHLSTSQADTDETVAVTCQTNRDKPINTVDLFCGAGGFSYGFELCSDAFNLVAGLDNNPEAVEAFNKNHNTEDAPAINEDISTLSPSEFGKRTNTTPAGVDLIIGGPPCKGFSSVRPRSGSDGGEDYRNYLYKDYFDYVEYFNPDVFVMENVPKLVTHTAGDERIFPKILARAEELGYTYDWKILNSAQYGVPQTRSRVVLIARKEDADLNSIKFPHPTHAIEGELDKQTLKRKEHMILPDDTEDLPAARPIEVALDDLPALGQGEEKTEYFCLPTCDYQKYLRHKSTKLTGHKSTNNGELMQKRLTYAAESRDDLPEHVFPNSGYSSTYSRLYKSEPSSTLTTAYTTASASRCIHPYENRALSPREGARIQSFPDHFEFVGNKTQKTSQVGNAVPPLLGKAVASAVLAIFSE